MHPVFAIDEIVRRIVEAVEDGIPRVSPSTLASLAQVNKAISEPALDRLWIICDDANIVPLLKTTNVLQQNTGCQRYCMPHSISDSGWNKFLSHSRRIRILRMSSWQLEKVLWPSVFAALDQCAQTHGSLIFPRLLAITSYEYRASFDVHLRSLASPCLRTISLRQARAGPQQVKDSSDIARAESLRASLASVAEIAPALKALDIDLDLDSSALEDVGELRHLQRVCFMPQNIPATRSTSKKLLISLSTLRHLTNLRMIVHNVGVKPLVDTTLQAAFPALEGLALFGSLADASTVLHSVSSNNLRQFILAAGLCGHPTETTSLLDLSLRLGTWLDTLAHINIVTRWIQPFEEQLLPAIQGIWKPLLALRRLKFLRVCITSELPISDRDVLDMAASWPELETLQLTLLDGQTVPSIFSLVHFARHCPRLSSLVMPSVNCVSTSLPEYSAFVISEHSALHGMKSFSVGGLPHEFRPREYRPIIVENSDEVAAWLAATFPQVKIGVTDGGPMWKDMVKTVNRMRQCR